MHTFGKAALVSGLVLVAVGGGLPLTVAGAGPGSSPVIVTNPPSSPVPVSGQVSVGNLPATQVVSGTVDVGNLPRTQAVTGAVSTRDEQSFFATSRTGPSDTITNVALPARDVVIDMVSVHVAVGSSQSVVGVRLSCQDLDGAPTFPGASFLWFPVQYVGGDSSMKSYEGALTGMEMPCGANDRIQAELANVGPQSSQRALVEVSVFGHHRL